jgi:hypothetical protein
LLKSGSGWDLMLAWVVKLNSQNLTCGYERVRSIKPVLAGDTIHVVGTVVDIADHPKKPIYGKVVMRLEVPRDNDEPAMVVDHVMLVARRHKQENVPAIIGSGQIMHGKPDTKLDEAARGHGAGRGVQVAQMDYVSGTRPSSEHSMEPECHRNRLSRGRKLICSHFAGADDVSIGLFAPRVFLTGRPVYLYDGNRLPSNGGIGAKATGPLASCHHSNPTTTQ